MSPDDDLDDLVRRADPDRWLAARFIADAGARADVTALYAFNHELARAAEVASQPLIGEIRLAWWREAVAEIFDGRPPRRHPVVQALERAAARRALPRAALDDLIDARLRDLDGWPLRPDEAIAYIDATAGLLMMLAALVLAPEADPHALTHAARAWGLAGLSRLPGRLPVEWRAEDVRGRVDEALALARRELRELPVRGLPAAAYAALSRPYASGRAPTPVEARLRLVWASLRGRI